MQAEVRPFPIDDTTPPVTKMNFVGLAFIFFFLEQPNFRAEGGPDPCYTICALNALLEPDLGEGAGALNTV